MCGRSCQRNFIVCFKMTATGQQKVVHRKRKRKQLCSSAPHPFVYGPRERQINCPHVGVGRRGGGPDPKQSLRRFMTTLKGVIHNCGMGSGYNTWYNYKHHFARQVRHVGSRQTVTLTLFDKPSTKSRYRTVAHCLFRHTPGHLPWGRGSPLPPQKRDSCGGGGGVAGAFCAHRNPLKKIKPKPLKCIGVIVEWWKESQSLGP